MLGVDPRLMANAIRFLSMDAIERAGEGHPGTPLGAADIATALFTRHLKFNPQDPLWFDRDRFVQSPGHGSMLIYSLLYLAGYEKMGIEEIKRFRVLGSHCEGHPGYRPELRHRGDHGPARAGHRQRGRHGGRRGLPERSGFGPEIVDHYTYALVGDGCLQEGIGQEVISLAGHLRLGKLIFLWDDNRMTDDGAIDIALADDMPARFRVSGWHVQEVDGHDPEAVVGRDPAGEVGPAAVDDRLPHRHRPRHPGRGRHARRPTAARVLKAHTDAAREYLGWPHPPFEIPEDILRSLARGRAPQPAGLRGLAGAGGGTAGGQAPRARPPAGGPPAGGLGSGAARIQAPRAARSGSPSPASRPPATSRTC